MKQCGEALFMKAFVTTTPLFDSKMAVQAYYLRDRDGDAVLGVNEDFRSMDEAFSSPGLHCMAKLGTEPFVSDKPVFAEINKLQLLAGLPTNLGFQPASIICTLPNNLAATDLSIVERCARLKELGYGIAVNGFPIEGLKTPLTEFADFVILDYQHAEFKNQCRMVQSELPTVRIVVSNIPNMDAYQDACVIAKALFSGSFYNQPITKGSGDISPIKINALQLMNQVNNEDFELEDIAKIIERDPSLSISLLRFINSGATGINRRVNSIMSAVAILGQDEVRRWAMVAISVSLASDRPGEITRLSLVRAKFAENLAGSFELGVFQSNLFLTGLFSLLDVMLQKPMAEAVNEVAVSEQVRQALVEKSGSFSTVMDLIYAYERADWDKVSVMMIQNDLKVESVTDAFVNALVWYNQLLAAIDGEDEAVTP
jgi:EAL and modified HD-GYP domain-containing signal transduction protein